ncbi:MAG: hypothetical protein ACRDJ4_00915 [Actinomycetota bacterium]
MQLEPPRKVLSAVNAEHVKGVSTTRVQPSGVDECLPGGEEEGEGGA